jgi:hypothetical protein
VVATINKAVDAVARCSAVFHKGHVRLFIQLHYQCELKGSQYQQMNKR